MKYVEQLTREDLAEMSPEEINEARERGQLNELLGVPAPVDYETSEEITRDDIKNMTNEQIAAALADGRLGDVMKGGK